MKAYKSTIIFILATLTVSLVAYSASLVNKVPLLEQKDADQTASIARLEDKTDKMDKKVDKILYLMIEKSRDK